MENDFKKNLEKKKKLNIIMEEQKLGLTNGRRRKKMTTEATDS